MMKLLKYKRIYIIGLIPISLLLIFAAQNSSFFAEQIYAKHIYKWISQIISSITGILPFSLAEVIVIAAPVVVLTVLVRFILKMFFEKSNRQERLIKGILNLLCMVSILLFSFTILAGLNYYRYSFSVYSNLDIQSSTVEELCSLTESLAEKADELRAKVPSTDKNGVFKLSMNHYSLARITASAYKALSKEYPVLAGSYGSPKPVLFSELMSKTEITGIFFPFTMEANVNVDIPDYSIPDTMLHELAHLRGFMREDEANYLAYLAGMKSDNIELQYSSTMAALVTAGNALYKQNPDLYFQATAQLSEGVIKDLKDNSKYWQKFDNTVISTVSDHINDTYLKANNQKDGVQSYGRMLDLLLAKYRKDQGKID
jgi:hypothetical protein